MNLKKVRIIRYHAESFDENYDDIAVEYPLTIKIEGEEFLTLVCSPEHLEELAVGILASEGLIRNLDQIESLSIDESKGYIYVELHNKKVINKDMISKRFIGSCCGKSRQFFFSNDVKTAKTIMTRTKISVSQCLSLMGKMQESSSEFHLTGGLHNAALCSKEGLIILRSDIGRHNALDKIYGYCIQNKIRLTDKVIVFSGRISSEILLKVSKIGAGIILSKSAPTSLALELANDLGITAIGFTRKDRLNIYTHPERIIDF
ncbi:formate dehydrogenase accessory sulfurtransferase FdhD [Bacillus sp. V3B]|uniref:formate dehydrogenase accessory sulfurtransferase FdhD n=1 Tax=Bacillus sp. V3B TaxID=2804915 RepID=UPI00210C1F0C|nr:formate dehydrogenase accessory sulfurtransferase FdhD [Bacillus sp. V3B]MCQ6277557.1 formate dehydrogenase accessory sulfurtransferase FdhD [Bacillus sp. V3B]